MIRLWHRHRWRPRAADIDPYGDTRVLYACLDCKKLRVRLLRGRWLTADVAALLTDDDLHELLGKPE